METRSVTPMRAAKTGYVVMSIVFCVVGVLFIALPARSAVMIGRVLGAAMAAFGAVKLVGYFSRDLYRLAFQYDLEFGILLIALGVIVLLRTNGVMDFICIAAGVSILADGLFKIQIAIDARRFGIRDWWLILVPAMPMTEGIMSSSAAIRIGTRYLTTALEKRMSFLTSFLNNNYRYSRTSKYSVSITSGRWFFTIFTVLRATHRFSTPSASSAAPSSTVSTCTLSHGRKTSSSPTPPVTTARSRISHQSRIPKRRASMAICILNSPSDPDRRAAAHDPFGHGHGGDEDQL